MPIESSFGWLLPPTPADAKARGRQNFWRMTTALTLTLASVTGAVAAEGGEGTSGNVNPVTGKYNDHNGTLATGYIFQPLGQFAFQADGGIGSVASEFYRGAGARIFWRDSEIFRFGFIGSYEQLANIALHRLEFDGELYMRNITVQGRSGYQGGDAGQGFFGSLGAFIYLTNDLSLNPSSEYFDGDFFHRLQIEWRPGLNILPGLTIRGGAGGGDGDSKQFTFGIGYYFGDNGTSLIEHHRNGGRPNILTGVNELVDEYDERHDDDTPPPPPPPPPPPDNYL